jgi:hypothetical protein
MAHSLLVDAWLAVVERFVRSVSCSLGQCGYNAIGNVEYNGQMGLWDSKVQSTLTAAVVL